MALLLFVQLCVVLAVSINCMAEEFSQEELFIERRAGGTDYSRDDQQALLKAHNNYRKKVNPPAARMNTLTWDSSLAIKAQQWVERCHYGHPNTNVYTDYAGLGQNLYIRYGTTTAPPVTSPVDEWHSEVSYYNLASNSCTGICGHYTQIVWADTTKVGCGIHYCSLATSDRGKTYKKAWLVACQYSPPGNVISQKPYKVAGK